MADSRTPMTLEQARERASGRREACSQLKQVLVERLDLPVDPDWITDDQPLFGRGLELDSVDALELAVGIDDVSEVSVTDEQVGVFGSINRIIDYIEAHREEFEAAMAGGDEAGLMEPTGSRA